MGAEAVGAEVQEILGNEAAAPPPPLIVGLQPSALVDHLARVDSSLLLHIPGAKGGSLPVYIYFFPVRAFIYCPFILFLHLNFHARHCH